MQFNLAGLHDAAEFPPAELVRTFQPDSRFEGENPHKLNSHDYSFHCRGLSERERERVCACVCLRESVGGCAWGEQEGV